MAGIQLYSGAEFGHPFSRLLRLNGAPIQGDQITIVSAVPHVFTVSVNPPLQTLDVARVMRITDGVQYNVTQAPLGQGPLYSLFTVTIPGGTLPAGGQYLLRVGSGNAVCEIELFTI